MAAPSSAFKVRWGLSEESTFGTALVVDTGVFNIFEGPPPTISYENLTDDKTIKHRGYQMADKNDSFSSALGSTVVISFSDLVVRKDELAILLYSVTQNMTEAAAGDFAKDIVIDDTFVQPDFSANAGLFHTVAIYDTIASNHKLFTSCILRTLTISGDLISGDGRLRVSGEFISGFAPNLTANFTDNTKWVSSAQSYFNYAAPTTKTLGGTNILMDTFQLTIVNNAIRKGNDSSGDAENYAFGEIVVTGSITALYDAGTDGIMADWIAGTARAIVLDHGVTTVDPAFLATMTSCEFTGDDQDYSGPARMVTMPFQAMLDDTSNAGIVMEVSDGIDRTW